jgi:hypothetical protein
LLLGKQQERMKLVFIITYDGSNEILINISNLEGGIYWFRIDTEIILLYRKVVVLD